MICIKFLFMVNSAVSFLPTDGELFCIGFYPLHFLLQLYISNLLLFSSSSVFVNTLQIVSAYNTQRNNCKKQNKKQQLFIIKTSEIFLN